MEYSSPAAFHSQFYDVCAYILFINELGLFVRASNSSPWATNGPPRQAASQDKSANRRCLNHL
jgi:fructose-1,6-bisphosphatase/inositol monophosphatase family enzyme